jgi:hypothetical protein
MPMPVAEFCQKDHDFSRLTQVHLASLRLVKVHSWEPLFASQSMQQRDLVSPQGWRKLQHAIPAAQQGRITMAVGLAEDANGAQRVLIGTSEPIGYLRPGVTLNPGEILAPGYGHAEADIVNFALQSGLNLLEVGATRPICLVCASLIEGAGAKRVTSLKVR